MSVRYFFTLKFRDNILGKDLFSVPSHDVTASGKAGNANFFEMFWIDAGFEGSFDVRHTIISAHDSFFDKVESHSVKDGAAHNCAISITFSIF